MPFCLEKILPKKSSSNQIGMLFENCCGTQHTRVLFYFFSIIHKPMAIKRPPAIQRIRSGETKRRSMSAKSTAIADVETRAADAAKNTVHLDFASEAKQKVASWVLSPNSATNIAKKVVKKSFQSIYQRSPSCGKFPSS